MGTDAELALVLAPAGGTGQAMAQLLLGISHLLAGRADQADRQLADAAEVGEDAGIDSATLALAERSTLAMARGSGRRPRPWPSGPAPAPAAPGWSGTPAARCCTRSRPAWPSAAATSPGPGTTWPAPSASARC